MKTLKKGDRVRVTSNSIFLAMGFEVVVSTVFLLYADGRGFALKCEETGAIETVTYGDGEISIVDR